jgi:hypothetical protein
MGKNTCHTPNNSMCVMKIILKRLKTNPFLFVEFKLIYIHKYVHSHYQKE